MVFGHALIILPALLPVQLSYTPLLYAPLTLLHASLALRMGAGMVGWAPMERPDDDSRPPSLCILHRLFRAEAPPARGGTGCPALSGLRRLLSETVPDEIRL